MISKNYKYFLKINTFGQNGFIRPIKEDQNKIEYVIIMDSINKEIFLFDHFVSFSSTSKLKDRENNNSSFFDLHYNGLDKMPISKEQYLEILNCKISFLHSCSYINFLKKFKLDEWII